MAMGSRVEIIESVLREEIVDSARTLTKLRANYIANRVLDLLDKMEEEIVIQKADKPPLNLFPSTPELEIFQSLAGELMTGEMDKGVNRLDIELKAEYKVIIKVPDKEKPMILSLPTSVILVITKGEGEDENKEKE